jgi:hypothetical protein
LRPVLVLAEEEGACHSDDDDGAAVISAGAVLWDGRSVIVEGTSTFKVEAEEGRDSSSSVCEGMALAIMEEEETIDRDVCVCIGEPTSFVRDVTGEDEGPVWEGDRGSSSGSDPRNPRLTPGRILTSTSSSSLSASIASRSKSCSSVHLPCMSIREEDGSTGS